jgi:hypothetical protein
MAFRELACALAAFAACVSGTARASSVYPGDASFCDWADLVFVGDVASRSSYLADPDHKRGEIYTDVTLEVLRSIEGPANATVTLTVPGGTIKRRSQIVGGIPTMAVGDRLLIFAHMDADPTPQITSLGLRPLKPPPTPAPAAELQAAWSAICTLEPGPLDAAPVQSVIHKLSTVVMSGYGP